ncbi:N-acetylmuramidase domain-containing protein [Burkholderia alba]
MKAQKWGEFTRNYNGFDYAYHLHDLKLACAYRKHIQRKIVRAK